MGANETQAEWRAKHPLDLNTMLNQEDAKAFAKTGYAGADQLLGAARRTDPKTKNADLNTWYNANGVVDQGLIDAFNAWNKKRTDTKQATDDYLKLKQETPGRSATILTDPSKTILGMPKSVL